METGKISVPIDNAVIEEIKEANEMSEKLNEVFTFFEKNEQRHANIKKMILDVRDALGKGLFLLGGQEMEEWLNEFDKFLTYEKRFKPASFIKWVRNRNFL